MRFLMYEVDNRASANTPPSPALMAEMGKLVEETTKAGILLATGGLGPNPTRVRSSGGKVAITDGPFTEAKDRHPARDRRARPESHARSILGWKGRDHRWPVHRGEGADGRIRPRRGQDE